MSRYKNTKIKTIDGKESYDTTLYEVIPEDTNDIHVMTQIGDRLDLLALQFYGDKNLWWYIGKANNLKFNNLEPGIILRIPASIRYANGQ
tara:strand:- start:3533 stop:3802 length:270 start_codon:yes stop_codon:yes gene_type:complete